jgi:hypothetical protein
MKEYDIGELVLYVDTFTKINTIGIISDKREDDGTITYSIDWADEYREDNYNESEVKGYINNLTKIS